jgi:hypothetical protein
MTSIAERTVARPKINVRMFYDLASKDEKRLMSKAVENRLAYLDEQFDIPENRSVYEKTKLLLIKTLNAISYSAAPLIGVDDSGQTVAEWRNYEDFAIITLTPISENRIIFRGIQNDGLSFSVVTTLENLETTASV